MLIDFAGGFRVQGIGEIAYLIYDIIDVFFTAGDFSDILDNRRSNDNGISDGAHGGDIISGTDTEPNGEG